MGSLGINKKPQDTKVVVAMSGGVDSSTVAAMMVAEGYNVIGMTMQLYDHGMALQKKGACCAGLDIYDAKQVAAKLNIPHYVLNYESRFKESVMDDFADSYLRGETPIPCVKCNQTVKFSDMMQMAKDLEADALVTGHYVQRIQDGDKIELHRAIDHTKDQSYFLFATTKSQLDYVRFPLGKYTKVQTRELAHKFGLETADKPDSQDICFVPEGSYAKVVERLRPGALDAGDIVHVNGQILGRHNGIINYTLGQRKGLGISSDQPLFVIKIDPEKKQVIVGPSEALNNKKFVIRNVNWLASDISKEQEVEVKMRSTQNLVEALVIPKNESEAEIILHNSTRAVTPGQACVIYSGNRVLGGGWITKEII